MVGSLGSPTFQHTNSLSQLPHTLLKTKTTNPKDIHTLPESTPHLIHHLAVNLPEMRSQLFQILLLLVGICELVNAQSMNPSNTMRRRDPLPTDVGQIEAFMDQENQGRRSRSRSKIVGRGHDADNLPLSNAQRMKLGLPLKPPTRHEAGKEQTVEGSGDAEMVM